ncbi:MAG: MarR family transcriptional regulator [Acidimicrobiia bacterium]|jgi:DNA-binding MarR family transcriptional regulator
MPSDTDAVDGIRSRLAELYPDLDTAAFGLTGRILRLARDIEMNRARHLSSFDLTPGDFDVLATIRRTDLGEGVNPGRLLESLLITSGGLTKRLDKLESAGLIERNPDPNDRRGTLIRILPAGTDLIDRAIPSLLKEEAEVVEAKLSTEQLDRVSAMLRRLMD